MGVTAYYIRAFLVLFGLLLAFTGVLAPISPEAYRKRLRLWLIVIGLGLIMVVLSVIYPSLVPQPPVEETPDNYPEGGKLPGVIMVKIESGNISSGNIWGGPEQQG
jgi:hypothetical protein